MRTKKFLYSKAGVMMLLALMTLSCGLKNNVSVASSSSDLPEVGTLTAYYAEEDLTMNDFEYKKGQLLCDSNDPLNRIIDQDDTSYKYEGDDGGGYYSWLIPKTKAKKVTYTMSQLPESMVGDKVIFKSADGFVAKIFKANINGHKFYSWVDSDSGFKAVYNDKETKRHAEFLVLSFESVFDGEKYQHETIVNVKDGYVDLYHENRYCTTEDPADCRYRKGLIGFWEDEWVNQDGWEDSAYSEDGRLLVDQYSVDGSIPDYCSVAYIADKDALYVNGTLYFRQK